MSKQAISYLEQNRDKYPKKVLIDALDVAGYTRGDINESVKEVYANDDDFYDDNEDLNEVLDDMYDSEGRRIYRTNGDKVKDFFIGLVYSFFCTVIPVIGWIIGAVLLFRYYHKRRYAFYGLLVIYGTASFFVLREILEGLY